MYVRSIFYKYIRKELGYKIVSDEISVGKQEANSIFDRRDYEEVFFRDLVEADKEIVISSPKLIRYKVMKLITLLKTRQEDGVTVTLITLSPDAVGFENTIELNLLIEDLKNAGIIVRAVSENVDCFAVIDKKIVWHGGMNLLGKAEAWDSLIRVENEKAAGELLEMAMDS